MLELINTWMLEHRRGGYAVIAGVFLCMTLIMAWPKVSVWWQTAGYEIAAGKVAEVGEGSTSKGRRKGLGWGGAIHYQYTVGGTDYLGGESWKFWLIGFISAGAPGGYTPGSPVEVRYDPEEPTLSRVIPKDLALYYLDAALVGLILAGILLFALEKQRMQRILDEVNTVDLMESERPKE